MTVPAPQYTFNEALGVCLTMCQRAMLEVRALARLPGPQGPAGAPGLDGKEGARGQKGEPGRNASDLAYLQDYITEQVERTFKTGKVETPDGGRTLRLSFGDIVHEIKTAMVIDAGIWKEGISYAAGDGVTLAGSFWIAQATTDAKPGLSADWRLAVKRGLDGRDAASGERVAKPVRFK